MQTSSRDSREPQFFTLRWFGWTARRVGIEFMAGWRDAAPEAPRVASSEGGAGAGGRGPRTSSLAAIAWGVGVAMLVAGFVFVGEGFAGNALTEAAGIAVSVGVALSLVERVSRRERERQWSRVRLRTTRAIKRRVWNIAHAYWLEAQRTLPISDEAFSSGIALNQPEHGIARTICELSEAMRTVYPSRAQNDDWNADPENPLTESPGALHAAVADDFRFLKSVLSPRVLALGADPELSALLLQLEDHEEDWQGWMKTAEDWGAPDSFAWEEATSALEVAATIYARLAEARPPLARPGANGWEVNVPH